jgi:transcriptional regulator with XRE-family HTH domain
MAPTGAMTRDAYGPNLRRIRLQRGISLEQLADATKVPVELWADLEKNDVSRWPGGIFARAYVRQYAYAIGVDPDSTVDEFCRWFPQGDRRAEKIVRIHAEIVGHSLEWQDDMPGADGNRRGGPEARPVAVERRAPNSARAGLFVRLRRAFGRA